MRHPLERIVSAVEGEAMNAIDPKDLHEMAEGNLSNYVRDHIHAAADEIEALRKDAGRYRWLREHFRFANDSMRELWFDPVLEPNDSGVPVDLDAEIDRAMNGSNV